MGRGSYAAEDEPATAAWRLAGTTEHGVDPGAVMTGPPLGRLPGRNAEATRAGAFRGGRVAAVDRANESRVIEGEHA